MATKSTKPTKSFQTKNMSHGKHGKHGHIYSPKTHARNLKLNPSQPYFAGAVTMNGLSIIRAFRVFRGRVFMKTLFVGFVDFVAINKSL
jgi:hypothetical protein